MRVGVYFRALRGVDPNKKTTVAKKKAFIHIFNRQAFHPAPRGVAFSMGPFPSAVCA